MKNTKVVEGYIFVTSGCEHGPTIMKWTDEQWSQKDYEVLNEASWCDNQFNDTYMHDGKDGIIFDHIIAREKPWAQVIDYNFIPGKKYRLTIEEL